MAELLVQIEDESLLSSLKKAIAMLRGVTKVSLNKPVPKKETHATTKSRDLNTVPQDIIALMGIAPVSPEDYQDERTAYILQK